MATAEDLRAIALSLKGTTEAPHFDRRAFKARIIYATLAPDGLTVNIRFAPDEQEFRCTLQPEAYSRVPNKWGASGWTTAELAALTTDDLRLALTAAWQYQKPAKVGRQQKGD